MARMTAPTEGERLARIETLLENINDRLAAGSKDFATHDDRIKDLEAFQIKFEASKNVLLLVAGAFGSFVGFVAALIIAYMHKG